MSGIDSAVLGFCAGCGGRIHDRYYLQAVDKQWHVNCLTCSDCNYQLESCGTCFVRDGNVYCKTDYCRRFTTKSCSRCSNIISANELIIRAKNQVFHARCFSCSACHRTLKPGDQYGLKNNIPFCYTDLEEIMSPATHDISSLPRSDMEPQTRGPRSERGLDLAAFCSSDGTDPIGRHRKWTRPTISGGASCLQLELRADISDRPSFVPVGEKCLYQPSRQKRVRTSFKQHQLRAMKSLFAHSHNPGVKELKELAQTTGLAKKVLQVWFQNSRAKYRRDIKQQADEHGTEPGQGQSYSSQSQDKVDTFLLTSIEDSPGLDGVCCSVPLSGFCSSTTDADHIISDLFTNINDTNS